MRSCIKTSHQYKIRSKKTTKFSNLLTFDETNESRRSHVSTKTIESSSHATLQRAILPRRFLNLISSNKKLLRGFLLSGVYSKERNFKSYSVMLSSLILSNR